MLGYSKVNEGQSEKKNDDPLIQEEHTKMHQMEKICMQQIKAQELNANDDYKAMREDKIIIEKTLHQMARERFNESKKKSEEEVSKEAAANDFLYPYLEKKEWFKKSNYDLTKPLSQQHAIEIK